MKFSICNLGCKVNAFEAESIASVMEKKGWTRVPFEEAADAVLIFTCAVTNMAASKSRKMMHRARRLNKDAIICMTGCYAEVDEGMLEDAEIIAGTMAKEKNKFIPNLFIISLLTVAIFCPCKVAIISSTIRNNITISRLVPSSLIFSFTFSRP